jgi:hypothetical protein
LLQEAVKGKMGRRRSGGSKEGWKVSGRVKRLLDFSGQSLLREGTTRGDPSSLNTSIYNGE